MLSGQQKKLPSTSDILFSSINFIILSNNMTMRILSEVTFPSEKKKKLSSWNSKRLLDYWQVNQVSNDMQHPEYEWWTKFQTSTDLTSNWAQQEGSACIPQIYFLQTKLPCAYLHSSVQCAALRIVDRNWSAERCRKHVRRREQFNCYICKRNQTLSRYFNNYFLFETVSATFFKWRFGMPLISKKKHQKLYFKWRFEMPIISSQFPLKAVICFICNVLGYQFSGNFKKIKKNHLWITLGSWPVQFPYTY